MTDVVREANKLLYDCLPFKIVSELPPSAKEREGFMLKAGENSDGQPIYKTYVYMQNKFLEISKCMGFETLKKPYVIDFYKRTLSMNERCFKAFNEIWPEIKKMLDDKMGAITINI